MTDIQLLIGTRVRCSDGPCGRLQRVIVQPAAEARLTHLAVKPDHLHAGRLVPADLIAAVGREVILVCTTREFAELETAEESAQEHSASWPYAGEEPGGRFPVGVEGIERDTGYGNRSLSRDRIPAGGVDLRRGEFVYATDGEVGRVQGLILALPDPHISYLLLSRRRLFGRTRITVPVGSVTTFGDGIQLDLTREQVRALPVVPAYPVP